jgi:UPF0716 family protein affecting phage T7 exclusion
MTGWLLSLLLAYLVAAWLGGIAGVAVLLVIGVSGTVVMLGAEGLHEWREARSERRSAYRRWAAWEFQDWLRKHTGWRS